MKHLNQKRVSPFLFLVLTTILIGCNFVAGSPPTQQPAIAPPTIPDTEQAIPTITSIVPPAVEATSTTALFSMEIVGETGTATLITVPFVNATSTPITIPIVRATSTSTPITLVFAEATSTFTPIAPPPPPATPEPLWVEPVISPTDQLTQVIVVYIGYGEEVTVTTEAGEFTVTGDFNAYTNPAKVEITLLPNTVNHLEVTAKVRIIDAGNGYTYGGYTLRTTSDRQGASLTIIQGTPPSP